MDSNLKFDGTDEQFNEILFNSSLLISAIYKDDPLRYLNEKVISEKIKHNLGKVCVSQSFEQEDPQFKRNFFDFRFIVSKNDDFKRLIVAFKADENINDFLYDGQHMPHFDQINSRFRSSLYERTKSFPESYFLHKLNYQDYQVILTGYSLSGAIAAMATINIQGFTILPSISKKTLFIGFGCPYIAEMYFESETVKENQFLFIKNRNDLLVDLLDYLIDVVYFQQEMLKMNRQDILDFILQNMNDSNITFDNIFDVIFDRLSVRKPRNGTDEVFLFQFLESILKEINIDQKIKHACKKLTNCLNKDKFELIFSELYIKEKKNIIILDETHKLKVSDAILKKIEIDLRCFESFFQKIRQHSMENYFSNLQNNYFKSFINQTGSIVTEISHLKDFEISLVKSESSLIDIIVDPEKVQMYFILIFEPDNNSGFIIAARCSFGDNLFDLDYFRKVYENKYEVFIDRDLLIDKKGKLLYNSLKLILYSHFNKPIEMEFNLTLFANKI
ncbi:unnamed protein product [Brachionus calyciflorus]|uniref:Fungal lipase-type domain-containing protein n=1 Tax=Brachionus calyciflorus TaxID=104777 RepID=A0A813M5S6_9BILA|nr:unnamed protein product [Brachionus calyciflorus]